MHKRQKKFINILSELKDNMSNEEIDKIIEELKPFLDLVIDDAYEEADYLKYEIDMADLDWRFSYFIIESILHLINIQNETLRKRIGDYLDKRIKELGRKHFCCM